MDTVATVAKKLIHALSQPCEIDGHMIEIGASIGVAVCPVTEADVSALFKLADKMLYEAKAAGRNTFRISQ
jgi:diguanylate cyclase (GGDEF)-like protein